jgi:hypothetical protein
LSGRKRISRSCCVVGRGVLGDAGGESSSRCDVGDFNDLDNDPDPGIASTLITSPRNAQARIVQGNLNLNFMFYSPYP